MSEKKNRTEIKKREKPNQKWSDEEIKTILNYLQEASEIEVPTAQFFYKKLIAETGINIESWELIRWKVRYLKSTFTKANDWRKSTGAGLLEQDDGISSVEGKVLRICPYYHQLNQIFGEKNGVYKLFAVSDTGNGTTMEIHTSVDMNVDDFIAESLNDPTSEIPLIENQQSESIALTTEQVITPHTTPNCYTVEAASSPIPKKAKDFAEKLKKAAPKSASAHLAAFQADRSAMLQIKIDWEKEKYEKDFIISEKKLKLEEEKIKAEIEFKSMELTLKEKEIQSNEKVKILALEKEERVQKYEIEMKYKFNSN